MRMRRQFTYRQLMSRFTAGLSNSSRTASAKDEPIPEVRSAVLAVTNTPALGDGVRQSAPDHDCADGGFDQKFLVDVVVVHAASATFRRINPLRVVVLAVNLG